MIRVLIADNNVDLCVTLQEFLEAEEDIEVCGIAYDGEEALDLLGSLEVDVLILDITMPRLDGMAVLERMESLGLKKRPRVIVLTALSRDDLIQRFTDLGADYFMVKPFDLNLLAERIRQFAHSQGSNASASVSTGKYRPQVIDDEVSITRLLQEMGVPAHFKGYNYLRDAVRIVLRDEQMLGGSLTKKLYPQLAEKYGSTPGGVEAAIRNAVWPRERQPGVPGQAQRRELAERALPHEFYGDREVGRRAAAARTRGLVHGVVSPEK